MSDSPTASSLDRIARALERIADLLTVQEMYDNDDFIERYYYLKAQEQYAINAFSAYDSYILEKDPRQVTAAEREHLAQLEARALHASDALEACQVAQRRAPRQYHPEDREG